MTAEETALQQFRAAVANVRVTRKIRNADTFGLRFAVASLARIIRAIRAEREKDELAALESEVLACCGARRDGYERGRRDALRGVQGACLFEGARITRHTVTSSVESIVALGAVEASAYRRVAKAAEEAAR